MTLPKDTPVFVQTTDPTNVLDWYLAVSQGDGDDCILRTGESIASYQLAPSAEAVAAGLQILTGAREPIREGLNISFWTSIASPFRSLPIYDGDGIVLGVELTIETDATPSRTKQVTVGQLTRQK